MIRSAFQKEFPLDGLRAISIGLVLVHHGLRSLPIGWTTMWMRPVAFLAEEGNRMAEVIKEIRAKPLLIVMATDERYAFPLSVAMASIIRSASGPIRFLILADRLRYSVRSRICRVANHANVACSIREVDSSEFQYNCGLDHLSSTAFLRLLLGRMLPEEDRCVWIDCDMVVNRDVLPLATVDLGTSVLGAVRDQSLTNFASYGAIPYASAWPGWNPTAPFFNSGFLVFDLAAWRRLTIDLRVVRFLSLYGHQLNAADQDVLNAVCANAWQPLPFFWNKQGNQLGKTLLLQNVWTDEEYNWISQVHAGEPTVTHFIGKFKPWNSGLFNRENVDWMRLASTSQYFSPIETKLWKLRRTFGIFKERAFRPLSAARG